MKPGRIKDAGRKSQLCVRNRVVNNKNPNYGFNYVPFYISDFIHLLCPYFLYKTTQDEHYCLLYISFALNVNKQPTDEKK